MSSANRGPSPKPGSSLADCCEKSYRIHPRSVSRWDGAYCGIGCIHLLRARFHRYALCSRPNLKTKLLLDVVLDIERWPGRAYVRRVPWLTRPYLVAIEPLGWILYRTMPRRIRRAWLLAKPA